MRVPSVVTAAGAVAEISDGAAIAFSGFCRTGVAQSLCRALTDRHADTGHPCDLTLLHAAGHSPGVGVDWLAMHGLARKIIGGHWGATPNLREMAAAGKLELHNWPQGVLVESFRAAAAGQEGFYTRIGLETFVDPRQLGGCLTESSRRAGSLIRHLPDHDGREVLHFPRLRPDFAFLRAWTADRLGNISLGAEPLHLSVEEIALATRNNGGRVFFQVFEVADRIFSSDEVHIPGFLVDAIVVSANPEEEHRHCTSIAYDPVFLGRRERLPEAVSALDPAKQWIGRRAAREVRDGDLLNLGIGIPGDAVPRALEESGRLDRVTTTLESGMVGGVAAGGLDFGVAYGPQARISEARMFDLYHGGNLDIAIMGMAETDAHGDINVSQFAGRSVGCGGFIDITQSTRRVVFCSPFNGRGFRGVFAEGALRILAEGTQQKFVSRVPQITFSSSRARALGQEVLLVTERCVFVLGDRGWILAEVAPGIDIERDVCGRMAFRPEIAREPRLMDPDLFA